MKSPKRPGPTARFDRLNVVVDPSRHLYLRLDLEPCQELVHFFEFEECEAGKLLGIDSRFPSPGYSTELSAFFTR